MSFIDKRGRVWWYFWRPYKGAKQKAKSLETTDGAVAEVRKGEEDKKRHRGEADLLVPGIQWDTAEKDFLAGYTPKSATYISLARSLKLFRGFAHPATVDSVQYPKAKEFRDWMPTQISRFGRPYRPATVNIQVQNLTTFFNEMKRLKYISENPFSGVKEVPDTVRAHRYLKKAQVQAILKEAEASWPKERVLMLLFFLYTGVRLGELVNLRWASIDMEKKLFHLHGSETWEPKDREENTIRLHPNLEKALKKHPRTSAYVFPGMSGGTRCKYSTERLFNRLYKRAGVEATGVHVLRHTFATNSGLSLKALQKVLGHADIKTTLRYAHVTPEELEAVTEMSYS